MTTTVEVFAPAKINLTLHVTGQREDGYHLLDSLVTFAGVGDKITLTTSEQPSFNVTGPFAPGVPNDDRNIALQAAKLVDIPSSMAITLEKKLPPASGIGGGSADAAAVFRGMMALKVPQMNFDDPATVSDDAMAPIASQLLELGADVPMCLLPAAARTTGIGEKISFVDDLPNLPAVLVTPPSALSTPEVFKALQNKANPPMPATVPTFESIAECAAWLAHQRNDLQSTSIRLLPAIGDVIDAIAAQPNCLLARMSGSGATCFGLFPDRRGAEAAATALSENSKRWWVKSCIFGGQYGRALPKIS